MNSAEPEITVMCITYNHERYIRDALEGFINQETAHSFEVIVHDDASTDGTAKIVEEYARKYPQIIKPILQKENQYSQGVSILDNYILPLAKGKYIALCEGDDYWCDSQKLQLQFEFLDHHPEYSACVHSTTFYDYRIGGERAVFKLNGDGPIPLDLLISNQPSFHTSSLFTRKKVLESMPSFAKSKHDVGDYPMRVYLALIGGVYYIDKKMSYYRYGVDDSWSSRYRSNSDLACATHVGLIEMLEEADKWSEHKYEKQFSFAILEQNFLLLDVKQKWHEMLSKQYRVVFKGCSLLKRARILVSAFCPPIGRMLTKWL